MLNKLKQFITNKRLIIAVILVASLVGNVLWLGGQWLEKDRAKQFNRGVLTVFQTVLKNGSAQITIGNQIIKLIKE